MLKGVGKGQGKGQPEGKAREGQKQGSSAGAGNTYADPGRPKIFQPTDQDRLAPWWLKEQTSWTAPDPFPAKRIL